MQRIGIRRFFTRIEDDEGWVSMDGTMELGGLALHGSILGWGEAWLIGGRPP